MFGKVSEDSFQNIFDLSFDSDDSKCVVGSRGLDFLSALSPNSLNSYNNNNNNIIKNKNNAFNSSFELDEQLPSSKSWRSEFSGSQQEELEQAFANLCSRQRQPSSSAQDAFASSFFPFSLNSISDKNNKSCDLVDNSSRKKLLYSAALTTVGSNSGSSASSTCSSSSSSAISCPSTSSGSLPASKVNPSRYKTELCRPYQENGSCKYGEKCQFAHGLQELRTVNRHPKYKTDLCKTYHSVGFCPYGPRCHFIHSLEELTAGTPNGTGQRNSPIPNGSSSVCSTPSTPTATSASTNEIAAAIAALRQLPIYTPERLSAPPGFGPRPARRPLESLGLTGLNSSGSSGTSSASSLSPSMLTDLEDGNDSLPRLPVFSRLSH